MKKIKKTLLLLLFLIMSATTFAACGENNGEDISGSSNPSEISTPDDSNSSDSSVDTPATYAFVKVINPKDTIGGSVATELEEGTALDLTAPAAVEGKEFKGWFYENGTPVAADTKMGTQSVVIYAKWEIKTYTVTVKQVDKEDVVYTFGVEACPATGTTPEIYDIQSIARVIESDYENTEKVEYTISGMPQTWALENYELTVTKTNYHIITVDGEKNRVQEGATFTLETPVRERYEFLGWKDAEGNDVEGPITVTDDCAFVSAWKKLPIEVELGENAIDISETCNQDGAFDVVKFSGKAGAYAITATSVRIFKLIDGEMSDEVITQVVLTEDETVSFAVTYGEDLETVGTITVERIYDPQIHKEAVKVADSALGSTYSTNPLTKYEGADDTTVAPFGFNNITRFDTEKSKAMWVAGYNNTNLSAYSEVWFALKIVNGALETKTGSTTTNSWIYFHLTQTADSVWDIEITIDGEIYETQESQSGTEMNNDKAQAPNTIATILYGNSYQSADGAYVLLNNSGATMTLYATEIMGYAIPWTPEISKYAVKAADSALGSTHSTNPLTKYEGTDDTTKVAAGFNSITRFDAATSGVMWMAGYNTTDLSAYNKVWFAVKVVNGALKTPVGDKTTNSWIYFYLTQTADSVWTIEITIDGKVYETQTNQSGTEYNNTSVQKANSLATVLYGNSYQSADGAYVFLNNNSGATMTLYATEILGEPDLTGMPSEKAKTVTDENGNTVWMLRDGASDDHTHEYEGTDDTTAVPVGFTQVKRYDSNTETGADGNAWTTARAWLTSYDDTDLSAYSEVWFAVKISSGYLNDRNTTLAFAGTWAYFHLTQTTDSVWTVEVVVGGEVKATYTGHNGNATTTQPKDSIAKIVYNTGGAGEGVYLWVQNGACSIYSTEVVGIEKAADTQA